MLVALPIAMFIIAAGWQVVLAGHAWWTVSESARVAARATYIASKGEVTQLGEPEVGKAADAAAVKVLPLAMHALHKTTVGKAGSVSVSAPIPIIGPLGKVIGRSHTPRITAQSRFGQ